MCYTWENAIKAFEKKQVCTLENQFRLLHCTTLGATIHMTIWNTLKFYTVQCE